MRKKGQAYRPNAAPCSQDADRHPSVAQAPFKRVGPAKPGQKRAGVVYLLSCQQHELSGFVWCLLYLLGSLLKFHACKHTATELPVMCVVVLGDVQSSMQRLQDLIQGSSNVACMS